MVFFSINNDTFIVYRNVMRITGLWPLARSKASELMLSVFLMLELGTIVKRLIDPYGYCNDQKPGDAEIAHTSWFVTIIIMRITIRVYGKKMIPLIEATIDDWSSMTDPKERKIMKRYDKFGTVFLITKDIGVMIVFAGWNLLSSIWPSKFPAQDQRICIFNGHIIWANVSRFFETSVVVIDYLTINLCTILVWSFTLHLTAQFKMLKRRFQEFLLIQDKKESRRVFRRLVDRHNDLFDLSGSLEDTFNFFSGLQIIRVQILICLYAPQLGRTINEKNFGTMLEILKTISVHLLTPIIYYGLGDYLAQSSEEIGDVFTQCNWYNLFKGSVTEFSIVIVRTRKSTSLTLWKFHKLNLVNLNNTLSALYSYVSLIVGFASEPENR